MCFGYVPGLRGRPAEATVSHNSLHCTVKRCKAFLMERWRPYKRSPEISGKITELWNGKLHRGIPGSIELVCRMIDELMKFPRVWWRCRAQCKVFPVFTPGLHWSMGRFTRDVQRACCTGFNGHCRRGDGMNGVHILHGRLNGVVQKLANCSNKAIASPSWLTVIAGQSFQIYIGEVCKYVCGRKTVQLKYTLKLRQNCIVTPHIEFLFQGNAKQQTDLVAVDQLN